MPRLSLGLVAFLAAIPPLVAQGQWSLRSTPTAPDLFSPRTTFDSARNVTVAMGYTRNNGNLQTWEWNATGWSLRHSGSPPTGFFSHSTLAFDSARGVSVLFSGGEIGQSTAGGTQFHQEWDGSSTTYLFPPQQPPGRTRSASAFDSSRSRLVVFGGGTEPNGGVPQRMRDTWEWDGSAWIQRNPLAAPTPRWGHAMSFDAVRRRVVLFGGTTRTLTGNGTTGTTLQDLWEYDGTIWVERTTLVAPTARHGHGMATDPARGITYVYGGLDDRGMPLADLWAWDGTRWRELFTPQMPGRRWDFALAFDALRGRLVLHGGTGVTREFFVQSFSNGGVLALYQRDTWEYTPGTSGSYTAFGSGCAGVQGVPAISARGGEVPTAGATFTVQVNHLPLTGAAWIFLGNSKTQYGALTLPFDLGAIGMQGCALRVSGDFLYPVTNVLGAGLWTIPIPADAAGLRFFNQAIVLDPSANSLGLTVSNGAEAVIGG